MFNATDFLKSGHICTYQQMRVTLNHCAGIKDTVLFKGTIKSCMMLYTHKMWICCHTLKYDKSTRQHRLGLHNYTIKL